MGYLKRIICWVRGRHNMDFVSVVEGDTMCWECSRCHKLEYYGGYNDAAVAIDRFDKAMRGHYKALT